MNAISFYDDDGRIVAVAKGDAVMIHATKEHATDPWVNGEWGDDYYILNERPTPRPPCPAALNGMQLTDVPIGATVDINGSRYTADDTTIDLEFMYPGTYKIVVSLFPYLDGEFEIENYA